jgi:DNA-directed RNA polymerase specialized sigma24 family protein
VSRRERLRRIPTDDPQLDVAIGCVCKVVERRSFTCDAFPELTSEDLVQECLQHILRAKPGYDPDLASWSHFCTMIAERKLSNLVRDRRRVAQRDARRAASTAPEYCHEPGEGQATAIPLADWLGKIHRAAKRQLAGEDCPRRLRRSGRTFFNVAQVVAAFTLRERFKLSSEAAFALFAARADLRAAVRFLHVPSPSWFDRSAAIAANYFEHLRAPQREAFALLLQYPLSDADGVTTGE